MTSRMPKVLPALLLPFLLGTPALAAPATKTITTVDQLTAAIAAQADGETWVIEGPQTYGLSASGGGFFLGGQYGWYFPIVKNNLTIIGKDNPVIYGTGTGANEAWGGSVYINGQNMAPANNKISITENTFIVGMVAFDGAAAKSLRVVDNTFEGISPDCYAIGNTYWGDSSKVTAPYSDVFISGNTFNKGTPSGDRIIKARLTQTFNMDMDFTANGAKIKQDSMAPYLSFSTVLASGMDVTDCKPAVKIGGTIYTRPQ